MKNLPLFAKGLIIKSLLNSPTMHVGKLSFVGTWKDVSEGYELIEIKFQCKDCGKIYPDATKNCECE